MKKKINNAYRIEPDNRSKGIVARASLFMCYKYDIKFSKAQRRLFDASNKQFPPSERELNWAKKVAKVEGYENPFIKGCDTPSVKTGNTSALPPAYLGVPKFKSCLSTKSMGTRESLCIPKVKHKGCPSSSWQKTAC